MGATDDDLAMAIAVYMLGFSTYKGFNTEQTSGVEYDEKNLHRIYEYAKKFQV